MNLIKLHKILSNTTGILWGMATGFSIVNFVEKPSLVTALGVVIIFGACCYLNKDENKQVDDSNDKDLELENAFLKLENANLKAIVKCGELVEKSSDVVIRDLQEQINRLKSK
jgi:hypothetical protein